MKIVIYHLNAESVVCDSTEIKMTNTYEYSAIEAPGQWIYWNSYSKRVVFSANEITEISPELRLLQPGKK